MIRASQFWRNPIIVKEIRTRMRGNRAFVLLTAHLLILALVLALMYLLFRSTLSSSSALEQRRYFGKAMFGMMIWLELVTISFIAPALTSGSISIEKERQSFDLIRVTLLPERSLIIGKYLSGLIFVFLLLFTSFPLQSPSFIIGGVLPQEIFISVLILAITSITFCAAGIFLSCLFSRTLISTVIAYAIAIFLVFGIPMVFMIVFILFGVVTSGNFDQPDASIRFLLAIFGWVLICITPLATIIASETIILEQNSSLIATVPLGTDLQVVFPSPWIPYVIFYLLVSLFLIWASVQIIKQVER